MTEYSESKEYRNLRKQYYARFGDDVQCPGMIAGGQGPFKSFRECSDMIRACLEKGEPYVYPGKLPDGAVV